MHSFRSPATYQAKTATRLKGLANGLSSAFFRHADARARAGIDMGTYVYTAVQSVSPNRFSFVFAPGVGSGHDSGER